MMVSKPYQHHMTTMFGLFLGVDEDIINVHKHKTMEVLPKHLIHESLEYERSFGQAIQHGPRFIVAHSGVMKADLNVRALIRSSMVLDNYGITSGGCGQLRMWRHHWKKDSPHDNTSSVVHEMSVVDCRAGCS